MKNIYIAIGAIVRDEGKYIREWIEYHKYIGVEKFYIVDNGSIDNTIDILKEYEEMGVVELNVMCGEQQQLNAYNMILDIHKEDTRWIAFIDCDEYIYIENDIKIGDFLREFEDDNALGINWICIGPSGIRNRKQGMVIENYTQALSLDNFRNKHIKSCVQPAKAQGFKYSPHTCEYLNDTPAVDENHNIIYGDPDNPNLANRLSFSCCNNTNRIALIHYVTKSVEEFYYRCIKGKAYGLFVKYNVFTGGVKDFKDNDLIVFDKMLKYVSVIKGSYLVDDCNDIVEPLEYIGDRIKYDADEIMVIQHIIGDNYDKHQKMLDIDCQNEVIAECMEQILIAICMLETIVDTDSETMQLFEEYYRRLYMLQNNPHITLGDIERINSCIMRAGFNLVCMTNIL